MKRKKERNTWLWLWIAIGIVAGFFAFGPLGAILGIIGGLYLGKFVQKEQGRKKR
jgi:membrane associated rhomboid family serine protease